MNDSDDQNELASHNGKTTAVPDAATRLLLRSEGRFVMPR